MPTEARADRGELAFDDEFLRRLELLQVVAKKVFSGTMRADRRSAKKGVSAEFADHRSYSAGDDIRHVDWHLYGRLGELFLKLYEEEENLHLTVLLDSSASMRCRSLGGDGAGAGLTKFDYARQVAAALAYIGLANLDAVHVVPFRERMDDALLGLRGKSRIFRVFEHLLGIESAGGTDLQQSFQEFVRRERRRGVVVVLSDFFDLDGIQQALKYLKYPRHSIYVLHVVDPAEQDPGIRGDLRLYDAERQEFRDINVTDALLQRYRKAFGELLESVESFCVRHEMGYCLSRTDVPFDELVLRILRRGGLVG